MPYAPGQSRLYQSFMSGRTTEGLATPLRVANRLNRPGVVFGQSGVWGNDRRLDDIVTPWLTVKPHFQLYSVAFPQVNQFVTDLPNTTAG